MKSVTIHSDGACHGNPGPGGWAVVLTSGSHRREISGGTPATTNNRMELQAAIEGLSALREPCVVTLFTDSQYLRQGILSWVHGWKRNGWMTQAKKPVKNEDLWRALDACVSRHQLDWKWLKGHAGHQENERCDVLATQEVLQIKQKLSAAELREKLREFVSQAASPLAELPFR
jgi:ribonuclease HI